MSIILDYIKTCPEAHQNHLNQMYQLIKKELPEAEEKLSYGMPTFYFKKNIVHFSDNQKHLGFYPTPSGVAHFLPELAGFKTSKGAIQFPFSEKLPVKIIEKILRFRRQEVGLPTLLKNS